MSNPGAHWVVVADASRAVVYSREKKHSPLIKRAKHSGDCRTFGFIAAPEFLGILRTAMSGSADLVPSFEIDKNVVEHDATSISSLIDRTL